MVSLKNNMDIPHNLEDNTDKILQKFRLDLPIIMDLIQNIH